MVGFVRLLDSSVLFETCYVLLEWVDVLGDRLESRIDAPMVLLLIWTASPTIFITGLLVFRWFTRNWIFSTILHKDRIAYDAVWRQVCADSNMDGDQEVDTASLEPLFRVANAAAALTPPGPLPELLQRHRCGDCLWESSPAVESVELIFGQAAVAAAYLRQHVQVEHI